MQGLYLITNDDPFHLLLTKLELALATQKVALLQYRRKKIEKSQQYNEIEKILNLCQQYKTPLMMNDDIQQAQHFGVGLHLGQDDGSIQDARKILGEHAIIGRTCLNSLDLAEQAVADGASYVAFGAIYGSTTKPQAVKSGLHILQQARQQFDVPICAIGGLTVENSQVVVDAGANFCAVVSDILGQDIDRIVQRVEAWAKLFERH
ncbi:MAG: thiamine phosphate synthase [Acinetobacter sp.]|nr:MAG: thiamine phosphate synthase [Acinetobacter sp.]